MVTTEGTLRIFTPHFASLYQGRKLFVCCTRNNICTGPRHVKARHLSRFWHGCCSWKNIRRNFDLGTWWALSWVSLSNVFTILSTGHGKYIIFQSLPDVCKYLSLRGYSYPRHAIILVVCPLKSLVDSHIRELRNRGVSPDVDDQNLVSRCIYHFLLQ